MLETRRRMLLGGLLLIAGMILLPAQSQATPGSGVEVSVLSRGSFIDDVRVKFTFSSGHHRVVSNAKNASEVVTQNLSVAPGGHTGWHTHPGPAVVTVISGTLTYYEGKGRCVGRAYPAGSAFVDPGMGHVHIARNEGTAPVQATVVFFAVPANESPRIDVAAPGNCPF